MGIGLGLLSTTTLVSMYLFRSLMQLNFDCFSDEEDTASARISNTHNQHRRSALPNSGSYFSPRY